MAVGDAGVVVCVDENHARVHTLEQVLMLHDVTLLHARDPNHAAQLLEALGRSCLVMISLTLPARGAFVVLSRVRELAQNGKHEGPVALMGDGSAAYGWIDGVAAVLPPSPSPKQVLELVQIHCGNPSAARTA